LNLGECARDPEWDAFDRHVPVLETYGEMAEGRRNRFCKFEKIDRNRAIP